MSKVFLIFVACVLLFAFIFVTWTQDELGYVLTLIKGHTVHVPFLIALICNLFLNVATFWFDVVVWALRVCSII